MIRFVRSITVAVVAAAALAGTALAEGLSVPVSFGDCRETIMIYGELSASLKADIHAPEIRDNYLTVKEVLDNGARVKKGQVVIRFDDARYRQELEGATQDYELKKADLDRTRFTLADERINLDLDMKRKEIALEKARTQIVRNAVLISKIELKKAELSAKLAALELEQARKNRKEFDRKEEVTLRVMDLKVDEAKRKMDEHDEKIKKAVIRAPRDGVIYKPFVRLNNEKGRVARNKVVSPGDKLLEIPSFERFKGVAYVPSMDVAHIAVGDPVTLRLTLSPDRSFAGRVAEKDAYPMTRNERLGRSDPDGHLKEFKVTVDVDGTNPIFRPGLTFEGEVTSTLARNCLFVPRAAVDKDEKGQARIFAQTPSGPSPRRVKVGALGFTWAEIRSGLAKGDRVLLGGTRIDAP